MRDEKVCQCCGAAMVWVGSIMYGGLECADGCGIEGPFEVHIVNLCEMQMPVCAAPEEDVDANIKRLNLGLKPEYAEWDDLS